MERQIRSMAEVQERAAAVRTVRRKSYVHKLEHGFERLEKISGTVEGHEDPKRIVGSFMVMAGLAGAAFVVPDHTVSSLASDTVGGLGGAFIGEAIAPISRRTSFKRGEYLKNLPDISQEEFSASTVPFFASYPDFLTDDEVRHRLRRTLPLEGEKPVSDKRYLIVDELARRYSVQHAAEPKNTGKYKSGLRQYVLDEIMTAQFDALEIRGSAKEIRREFLSKAGDIVSSVMAVALAGELLNQYFHSSLGAALGLVDDLALLATVIGSIALRKLTEDEARK